MKKTKEWGEKYTMQVTFDLVSIAFFPGALLPRQCNKYEAESGKYKLLSPYRVARRRRATRTAGLFAPAARNEFRLMLKDVGRMP